MTNAVGAKITSGGALSYGWSVDNGVKELELYLKNRFSAYSIGNCTDSRIIIVGYSQGAQVLGNFLGKINMAVPEIANRIDYVAFLGDPKLSLPEGVPEWYELYPRACRGISGGLSNNTSPWRVYAPECMTHQGALEARNPYVPDQFAERAGLWCLEEDSICDSNYPFHMVSAHLQYSDYSIEDVVIKALFKVAMRNGDRPQLKNRILYSLRNDGAFMPEGEQVDYPKTSRYPFTPSPTPSPTKSCRTYFLIDTAQPYYSTQYYEDFLLSQTSAYRRLDEVLRNACQTGLATYSTINRDEGVRIVQAPTSDKASLVSAINKIITEYYRSSNYSSTASHHRAVGIQAIGQLISKIGWGSESIRNISLFTYTDGGYMSGTTDEELQLRQQAEEKSVQISIDDPCSSVWFVPSALRSNNMSAQAFICKPNLIYGLSALVANGSNSESITRAMAEPSQDKVYFEFNTYYARPGEEVTFRLNYNNPTVSMFDFEYFGWDFDGDMMMDSLTSQSEVKHIFDSEYRGSVCVDSILSQGNGSKTIMCSDVVIDNNNPEMKKAAMPAPYDLKVYAANDGVDMRWKYNGTKAKYWSVSLNDSPLITVAGLNENHINISDVSFDKLESVSLGGVSEDGYRGDIALWQGKTFTDVTSVSPVTKPGYSSDKQTVSSVKTGSIKTNKISSIVDANKFMSSKLSYQNKAQKLNQQSKSANPTTSANSMILAVLIFASIVVAFAGYLVAKY